jgi:hypothetical protein
MPPSQRINASVPGGEQRSLTPRPEITPPSGLVDALAQVLIADISRYPYIKAWSAAVEQQSQVQESLEPARLTRWSGSIWVFGGTIHFFGIVPTRPARTRSASKTRRISSLSRDKSAYRPS